jgi:hypothetical protein
MANSCSFFTILMRKPPPLWDIRGTRFTLLIDAYKWLYRKIDRSHIYRKLIQAARTKIPPWHSLN